MFHVGFCRLRSQCGKQLNSSSPPTPPNPFPAFPYLRRVPGPPIAEARHFTVNFSILSPCPHPISNQLSSDLSSTSQRSLQSPLVYPHYPGLNHTTTCNSLRTGLFASNLTHQQGTLSFCYSSGGLSENEDLTNAFMSFQCPSNQVQIL